jgi:glucose-1-phosphate thymidylyltransferase
LVSLANRPLVGHALDWLDRCGVREAAIVVPEAVAKDVRDAVRDGIRRRVEITWVEQLPGERFEDSLTGLDGFIASDPFVLHLADTLAREELAQVIRSLSPARDGALLLVEEPSGRGRSRVVPLRARGDAAGNGNGNGRARFLRSAAGVAVIGPAVMQAGAALDTFPQAGLEVVADRVRELGGTVQTRAALGWWRFRAGADALLEGNRFALEGLTPDHMQATLLQADIQGAVVAHPTAQIESSIVRGPTVIGPGARLRDAYVGPYTSVGPDVVIEGAEVEHSVILAGACIEHLGERLEASIVGAGARVARDFRLPRALRLNVGEGAEVSLT